MKASITLVSVLSIYPGKGDYDRALVLLEGRYRGEVVPEKAYMVCKRGQLSQGMQNQSVSVDISLRRARDGHEPQLAIFLVSTLAKKAS